MEFKIEKKILLKELNRMSKIISNNAALLSLRGLYLIVKADEIIFTGSNDNISLKSVLKKREGITIEKLGKTLIPFKVFYDVVRKQKDGIISLKNDDYNFIVESNNSRTLINFFETEKYPKIQFEIIGEEINLNSNILTIINKKISFAASENNQKIILNGINFSTEKDKLIATATNSYRLAILTKEIKIDKAINITFFAKILKDIIPYNRDVDMNILIDEDRVNVSYENLTYQLRLIDMIYPKVQDLIPRNFIAEYSIEKREFIETLERVIAISNQTSIPIKLTKNKDNIIVESKQSYIGGSTTKLPLKNWNGNDLEITFDSKYMIQALKAFDEQNITIKFAGQFQAIVISSENEPSLVQVVLPHRTY